MTASPADIDFPRQLGQYRVIRELGRGGMARVFEAEHLQLKKRVAIKVLHSLYRGDAASEARFLREGRAAARVRHLHVVEVFDVGVEGGTAFLVMEYLEGQTLAQMLQARGALPLPTVAEIFLPVLSAVAAAHDQGLVHRDLKPSNVMLTLQGRSTLHPVVLDFGISKLADEEDNVTVSGTVLGTLHYLAPEQANGAKYSSARSDQYSLGVMLYECVTGERPFSGDGQYNLMHAIVTGNARPPEELNASLPKEVAALIRRAMQRAPERRFASVRDLARALLPFASAAERARWAPEFDPSPEAAAETAASIEVMELPTAPSPVFASRPKRLAWLRNIGLGLGLAGAGGLAVPLATPSASPDIAAASVAPPAAPTAPAMVAVSTAPAPAVAAQPTLAAALASTPASSAGTPPPALPSSTTPPRLAAPPNRQAPRPSGPKGRLPFSTSIQESGTNNAPIIE